MSSFSCEPCDKFFTGIIPYNAHMVSQKHLKKVTGFNSSETFINTYFCPKCEVSLHGLTLFQEHLNSKLHQSKLNAASHDDTVKSTVGEKTTAAISELHLSSYDSMLCEDDMLSDKYFKKNNSQYTCSLCNVSLNSMEQARHHFVGIKHQKMLRKENPGSSVGNVENVKKYYGSSDQNLSNKNPYSLLEDFCLPEMKHIMGNMKIIGVDDPITL